MEEYYLFTFESTHAAIATEKLLKPAGGVVMPVPRFISSSCGISIRINPENHEQAQNLVRESSIDDYNYYHVTDGKCERVNI